MKIAVICDVLGDAGNGTAVAALNLIESMRRRGHTVNAVCCDPERMGKEGWYVLPRRSFGPFGGYFARMGVSLARPVPYMLRAAIDGADVVHCMLPFALTRRAVVMAKEMGIPVTAGFHCQAENFTSHFPAWRSAPFVRLVYRRYYRTVYSQADCVHYPSRFIRGEFERVVGRTNGVVVSNGVGDGFAAGKDERPDSMKDRFVILSAGRYSREKDHKTLIRAVGISAHSGNITLVIAGRGPLENRYRRLAARCGAQDMRLGFVPRESMPSLMRSADLYVHTADAELEGIACLEAMKSGRAVVVSDSPRSAASSFAADGRSLYRAGSASDLARRIDYWIEHPTEREAAGKRYAECGCAVDAERCMDEMERMFAEAAAKKREKNSVKSLDNRKR